VANKYVAGYGAIYIEDVNINITDKNHENHSVTKIVQDASWGKFFELLNSVSCARKRNDQCQPG
jgi:hypothetical protein